MIASLKTTPENFYDVNHRWLQSGWGIRRAHLLLDWTGDAPAQILRLSPDDAIPEIPALPFAGRIESERKDGEVYQAAFNAVRPSFVSLAVSGLCLVFVSGAMIQRFLSPA